MAIQVKTRMSTRTIRKALPRFRKDSSPSRRRMREQLKSVIRWCVDNVTSHTFVIRPHPVERREYWENFVGGHPRVHIALNTHHIP